jgi:hypothetical protein
VTSGADGELKLWRRSGCGDGAADRWRCAWAATLASLPLAAVAMSDDGTLVAAAAGPDVGLWRAADGARLAVHAAPPAARGGPLTELAFVAGTPVLVGAYGGAHPCVAGWDVVAGRLAWAARARGGRLSPARGAPLVAVALAPPDRPTPGTAPGGRVLVLAAADGAAVAGWDLPRGAADALAWADPCSRLAAAAAPASPAGVPPLIIVTSDREFCLAAAAGAVSDEGARPTTAADAAAEPVAGLDAAFGGAGPRPIAQAPISGLKAGRGPAWGALFDAPSHALAPPAALAPRFLECLLLGKD